MVWIGVITILMYAGTVFIGLDTIREKVENLGVYGPLVFIAIKASTIIFAPLAGSPLYFIAGPLFGFWSGLLYVLIGETVGSIVAFYISRFFGRKILKLFLSRGGRKSLDGILYHIGNWKGLIYARLIFVGLQDVVSYAAGLTKISFWQFFWVSTLLGIITLAPLVAVGLGLVDQNVLTIVVVVVAVLALSFLIIRLLKRKNNT